MSATRKYFLQFCLCALALAWLVGCSGPTILTVESKKRVRAPIKTAPASSVVPATQKPYKIDGKTYYPLPSAYGFVQEGMASWYGSDFHGKKTSNGEPYNMYAETAAHKTLPMNTRLLVKNLENGKEMVVRVNDRGPFVKGRIIDLSLAGAEKIGMAEKGTARVRIIALGEAITYKRGKKTYDRFVPHQNFRSGDFFVQIGSFRDKANAERLKNKMLRWGKKTVILPFDNGDKKYYRVQVQAGKTLAAAERTERALEAAGFPGAFVIAR